MVNRATSTRATVPEVMVVPGEVAKGCVCRITRLKAPGAAIDVALTHPDRLWGSNLLSDPNKPGAPAYPEMTPESYLHFIADVRGFRRGERRRKVQEVAEMVKLGGVMSDRAGSGGGAPASLIPDFIGADEAVAVGIIIEMPPGGDVVIDPAPGRGGRPRSCRSAGCSA